CVNPFVRKEVRQLNLDEFNALINAYRRFKENSGPQSLDGFTHMHIENAWHVHGTPLFLAWHRRYIRAFEEALRIYDPSVSLPYWDWGVDAAAPDMSIVFSDGYFGGNGRAGDGCIVNGPFSGWMMNIPYYHCLQRQFNLGDKISPFWPTEAIIHMQQTVASQSELSRTIEGGCHGAVHLGIGGEMASMNAPNDIFFFMHHATIDKIWAEWQAMDLTNRLYMYDGIDNTGRPVSVYDPLPGFTERVVDVMDLRSPLNCYYY
ncbi:Di-copper centre-containing protein, partial [Ramicandelaber brevisporus]